MQYFPLRLGLLMAGLLAASCAGGIDTDDDSDPTDDDDTTGTADDDDDATAADDDDDVVGDDWDVCINEFMAANSLTIPDDTGAYPDWIELHNLTDEDVELAGWGISDDLDDPFVHTLGDALFVPAGGYLLLWADGLPDLGDRHLGFRLSSDGEELGLYRPSGQAVNTLVYDSQVTDWSAARMPDGGLTWEIDTSPTPGQPNG